MIKFNGIYYTKDQIGYKLTRLGNLKNNKVAWIQKDLSLGYSNCFTRLIWSLLAKFCQLFRNCYHVNLDQSQQMLEAIRVKINSGEWADLESVFNSATNKFNEVTKQRRYVSKVIVRHSKQAMPARPLPQSLPSPVHLPWAPPTLTVQGTAATTHQKTEVLRQTAFSQTGAATLSQTRVATVATAALEGEVKGRSEKRTNREKFPPSPNAIFSETSYNFGAISDEQVTRILSNKDSSCSLVIFDPNKRGYCQVKLENGRLTKQNLDANRDLEEQATNPDGLVLAQHPLKHAACHMLTTEDNVEKVLQKSAPLQWLIWYDQCAKDLILSFRDQTGVFHHHPFNNCTLEELMDHCRLKEYNVILPAIQNHFRFQISVENATKMIAEHPDDVGMIVIQDHVTYFISKRIQTQIDLTTTTFEQLAKEHGIKELLERTMPSDSPYYFGSITSDQIGQLYTNTGFIRWSPRKKDYIFTYASRHNSTHHIPFQGSSVEEMLANRLEAERQIIKLTLPNPLAIHSPMLHRKIVDPTPFVINNCKNREGILYLDRDGPWIAFKSSDQVHKYKVKDNETEEQAITSASRGSPTIGWYNLTRITLLNPTEKRLSTYTSQIILNLGSKRSALALTHKAKTRHLESTIIDLRERSPQFNLLRNVGANTRIYIVGHCDKDVQQISSDESVTYTAEDFTKLFAQYVPNLPALTVVRPIKISVVACYGGARGKRDSFSEKLSKLLASKGIRALVHGRTEWVGRWGDEVKGYKKLVGGGHQSKGSKVSFETDPKTSITTRKEVY